MKTVRLGDISSYVNDKIKANDVLIDEFITTDNMLQNKQGIELSVISPLADSKLTHFKKNDILIANIRPYLKKIWYANFDGGCSSDVLVVRANQNIDNHFLYYALFRDDFFDFAMKGAKGTKMPRGDKNQIMNFKIPDIDLKTQQSIAHILSLLDKKIALNNQINTQLENLAKTLYDYWFVQFDFPDKNGKPYRSSGGEMVYNKTLKREIPKGWSVGKLGDIANITMGQSPNGESYNENGVGTIFFQGSTDFNWRFPTIRQYTTEPSRMAKQGDILLSVRAPVGDINIASNDCCIGRGLSALNSKNGFDAFLFYIMKDLKQIFDNRSSQGTTFGSITKDDLFGLLVIVPTNNILTEYENIAKKYHQMIFNLSQQNQQLTQLRDFLLPMLMNGQVVLKNPA